MASRNARGIFLEPRNFTVMNVADAVVTTQTHTMSGDLAPRDVEIVSLA